MKNQHIAIKIRNAANGLRFAWQDEHNFRLHVIFAATAIGLFLLIQPGVIWWALIILCIALVLAAELLNSAVEALTDHLHPEFHTSIGKVKDMLAGMVLVVSIAAFMVAMLAIYSSVFSFSGI